MKLLISAYACRPNMGSEPAVGWNWVIEYSKLCDIVVLTNFTNKVYIENYLKEHTSELKTVKFVYVKPNMKVDLWYKEWERMERLYYFFWQHTALKVAKKMCAEEHFDFVQHITYVSCVMPTYMYKLDIPFIYGPVSGGESIPAGIHYPFGTKEKIIETIRKITQIVAKNSLNLKRCCKNSSVIVVVTNESKKMIPQKYQEKVTVLQAIGLNRAAIANTEKVFQDQKSKFLIAGRMLSWKGFRIGIEAFIDALNSGVNAELTVLGTGNTEMNNYLKSIVGEYLNKKIFFVDSVNYDKMAEFYDQHDVLLNCSLRDSGCLVVMEAMGRGLPVICIDTGGPKVNTENGGAIKIGPNSYDKLKRELTKAIKMLTEDQRLRNNLSQESRMIALKEFEYESKVSNFYFKYLEQSND